MVVGPPSWRWCMPAEHARPCGTRASGAPPAPHVPPVLPCTALQVSEAPPLVEQDFIDAAVEVRHALGAGAGTSS